MNCRALLAAVLGAAGFCTVAVSASAKPPASPPLPTASVTIAGDPANGLTPFAPLTLSMADLASPSIPQATYTTTIGGKTVTETGRLVSALLARAGFKVISACRNDELRYWVEASSLNGSGAEITDAELDTGFGNKPAILSLSENGVALRAPRMVVPSPPEVTDARDIPDVFNITVGRAAPQFTSTTAACNPPSFTAPVAIPTKGSVVVNGSVANPSTLTFSQLQALPQITQTDQFQSGASQATRMETGPLLYGILDTAAPQFGAGPNDDLRFYVEATSSEDGAPALVSWAEIDPSLNGNQVLLSLLEGTPPAAQQPVLIQDTGPRLTVPGDVRGGRYDFGVQAVTVFRAPNIPAPPAGSGPSVLGNQKSTSFENAYLVGASMQGDNLNGGDLIGAILVKADLTGANLNKSDLSGALLNGANLTGANLNKANLTGANLTGASLSGANVNGVIWSNTTCPDGTNSDADGGSCAGRL